MKCPGCGGEVPHVALKCKHCGAALKKQAPPPAAKPAARPPKPDDPLKALAKEALAQQKAKQGPAKAPPAEAKGPPAPRKKTPTGSLAPDAAQGASAGEGEAAPLPKAPPDPRRQLMINVGVGVALVLAAAIGWRTEAAQAYVTNWAATTAVRDLPFDVIEGEYLGAGLGQVRVPESFKELEGMPAGTRGLAWNLELELAFRGRLAAAFTLVGKRLKYEEAVDAARALDPGAREFTATYGKNTFRSLRYRPPADGAAAPRRILRFYQSKKEAEAPFSLEFAYEETAQTKVIMDKLIDRVLTSIVE